MLYGIFITMKLINNVNITDLLVFDL